MDNATDQNDLSALRNDIERRTGFPSELKVADILLRRGWTFKSNPRYRRGDSSQVDRLTEVDFLAQSRCIAPLLDSEIGEFGHFRVTLLVEVKHFRRPLVVFTSPASEQDGAYAYAEIHQIYSDQIIRSIIKFDGFFKGREEQRVGRAAVVVNTGKSKNVNSANSQSQTEGKANRQSNSRSKTDEAREFDISQINSSLNSLYDACNAFRDHILESRRRDRRSNPSKWFEIILPLVIYDGDLLSYSHSEGNGSLDHVNIVYMASNFLGDGDRLYSSLAWIVKLDWFESFLIRLEGTCEQIKSDDFSYQNGYPTSLR
jgi:hypothetical protein